ncbi:MAG: HD-GYP domain-containing protein [Burkholderiaceae bacterium]|nr:HD-GYP domain-containing protein [Burkholderiaceae bacterium]
MLKKIAADQLAVGMYLHKLGGSWINHPFWRSSFVISTKDEIRQVVDSGIAEVWIDTEKGKDVSPTGGAAEDLEIVDDFEVPAASSAAEPIQLPTQNEVRHAGRVTMQDEVRRAAKICDSSKKAVRSMFEEVRMGKAISVEVAGEVVEEISSSVVRNPGALISLARLKTADDYTYMHSVAVCALMVALTRQLGLNEEQTREAGLAGLLHDLGKAVMPTAVLNKPGKLTDEEFSVIKQHPVEGHRMLLEGGAVGEIPLDVCLHHHEKVGGGGYPHGLKGDQIGLYAKMGAVCDVYDAITSNRPYKAGWEPAESIARMTEWSKGHFDERVFQAFVRSIGIYPVGSLVRLASGRLGVVMEQSEKSLLMPKVKTIFSTKSKTFLPPEILDLSRGGNIDQIVGREDAAKWGIRNLEQLWAP